MPHYEVVFKVGYDIDAKDVEEAVYLARREFAYEILSSGVENFAIDVDGEVYPL